jgi:hypothetical protein
MVRLGSIEVEEYDAIAQSVINDEEWTFEEIPARESAVRH